MTGDPRHFESIGSRLGFRAEPSADGELNLVWRGGRFPALLCLGIAAFLLLLSVPVFLAIRTQGLDSAVGNLWYFPTMNVVLFGVALFLLTLKRVIRIDRRAGKVYMTRSSLLMRRRLTVEFDEVRALRVADDQVYSGFAVAGSTAGQKWFPARSLRCSCPARSRCCSTGAAAGGSKSSRRASAASWTSRWKGPEPGFLNPPSK